MNPLQMLRFSNFRSSTPTVSNDAGFLTGTPDPAAIDNFGIVPFQLEHTAADRLNQIIANQPVRNKPGLIRTLLATAASGLNPEGAEKILYAPYDRAMIDWNARLKPAENAAALERQSNAINRQVYSTDVTNARQFEYNKMRDENADRDAKERERHNRAVEDETTRKNDIIAEHNRNMDELRRYKNEHPDAKPYYGGPTVLYFDPTTKEVVDTKIPTGHVSDTERINLGKEAKLEEIKATGKENRQTEEVKQGNRLDLEDKKQTGRESSINLRESLQGTTKDETANNQQTRFRVNAERLMREDPNGLGKFIKLNPNNPKGFDIVQSSNGFFGMGAKQGPTPEELKRINDYINNTGAKGTTKTNTKSVKITAPLDFNKGTNQAVLKDEQTADGKYIRTFKNGNVGEWTGTAWKLIKRGVQ